MQKLPISRWWRLIFNPSSIVIFQTEKIEQLDFRIQIALIQQDPSTSQTKQKMFYVL